MDGFLGYSRREKDGWRVGVGAEDRPLDESQRRVPRSISQQTTGVEEEEPSAASVCM